ncbi:DUF945 domain-containing protein, partial [Klebsiella pneumoniae]|nr:DUF945 domain-containing protein [Klebsiella pneumoniae]MCQ1035020.1 DUF945 domain-containing protein [Klebsiella pneumoniae]MCQ9658865.1 DUF945 domain-containing protein [Klebsiella pneumoniae]
MLVYALAANGSQTGEGYIQGQVQQVPAQSQNRGPGNSTGDGLKNSGLIKEKKMRLASRFGLTHSIRQERPLTNDELVKVVPSVFSEEKHNSRSDRYTYIPTITLLDKLR